MPLNFEFEFFYPFQPSLTIRVRSAQSGLSHLDYALLDTGADVTLLDSTIARHIGLDISDREEVLIGGIGGVVPARFAEVEISLLDERDLSIVIPAAFAEGQAGSMGNLIGLDVLEHFDFGLSHADRLGYLGRATR